MICLGKTYIAINKNEVEKAHSSSGGCFYPIAASVIQAGGAVFGVAMNEDFRAAHECAWTLEEARRFCGSKYLRSDLGDSYPKAEKILEQGKCVLFTGTPCQCAGLKAYLGGDLPGLFTCEIICHANPSPKVFRHYIKNIEKIYGKQVKDISFRSKETGWRNQVPVITFADGQKAQEASYFQAFVREMINRPSCYKCRFAGEKRYSDFTIGDFWGIETVDPTVKDDDTGISLLDVNTPKGEKLFEEIKSQFFLKPVDAKIAYSHNRHCNVKEHINRERFFRGVSAGCIDEGNVIYYMKRYVRIPFYKRVFLKLKRSFM